jgi:hypothetical protein
MCNKVGYIRQIRDDIELTNNTIGKIIEIFLSMATSSLLVK